MIRVTGLCLLLLLSAAPARAIPLTLVDTQPDPSCGQICPGYTFGFSDGGWLGVEFSLADAYTLTSVEGWIQPFVAGDVMVAVYSNAGGVPGASIFSQKIALPGSADYPFLFGFAGWYGATGVNWTLGPGSYWAVFGVPYAALPSAAMPSTSAQLSNIAGAYSGHGLEQGWNASPFPTGLGLRIQGQAVPEPSALLCLASAALAFAARSRAGRRLTSGAARVAANRGN